MLSGQEVSVNKGGSRSRMLRQPPQMVITENSGYKWKARVPLFSSFFCSPLPHHLPHPHHNTSDACKTIQGTKGSKKYLSALPFKQNNKQRGKELMVGLQVLTQNTILYYSEFGPRPRQPGSMVWSAPALWWPLGVLFGEGRPLLLEAVSPCCTEASHIISSAGSSVLNSLRVLCVTYLQQDL